MKKLMVLLLAALLVLAVIGCACGTQTERKARGELTVLFDREITGELLRYFQANQDCTVTPVLLNDETDYETITGTAALLKDEATAEKLKAKGWTETQDWTDAQKEQNAELFKFIVLIAPNLGDAAKTSAKILTDWVVGDSTYQNEVPVSSGGCSCKTKTELVTFKSDAPLLAKSEEFAELLNP